MRKSLGISFFTVLILTSCTHNNITPDNKPNLRSLSAAEQNITTANNDFSFDLFRTVQNGSTNSNIFISPLSVTMAMAMTMNGACDSTRQSILNVLKFGTTDPTEVNQACKDLTSLLTSMDRTVQLGLANSMWNNNRYTLRDSFTAIIKNYYDGTAQGLDFSDPKSVNVINSWIASKTNNLIQNMIEQTNDSDAMFLINAIYFKGDWTYQFDQSLTYSAPFYNEDGSTTNVQTMVAKEPSIAVFQNQNLQLIDIPYGNKQFSMTVLMSNSNFTMADLLKNLSTDSLNLWLSKCIVKTPRLELAKFEMKWKKDVKKDLIKLGIDTVGFPYFFNENLELAIAKVIHQSYIKVEEKGTEAAAATVVEVTSTVSLQPEIIRINRPFIYTIREKHSGAILFIGQMILP